MYLWYKYNLSISTYIKRIMIPKLFFDSLGKLIGIQKTDILNMIFGNVGNQKLMIFFLKKYIKLFFPGKRFNHAF